MGAICFISGHRDATQEEFDEYYVMKILAALMMGSKFVVGDCDGIDTMAQQLIKKYKYEHMLTIYHIGDEPMNSVCGANHIGGFKSDVDRDFAMTKDSTLDIAWIRSGKERSGTGRNLERRKLKNENPNIELKDILTDEASQFL